MTATEQAAAVQDEPPRDIGSASARLGNVEDFKPLEFSGDTGTRHDHHCRRPVSGRSKRDAWFIGCGRAAGIASVRGNVRDEDLKRRIVNALVLNGGVRSYLEAIRLRVAVKRTHYPVSAHIGDEKAGRNSRRVQENPYNK